MHSITGRSNILKIIVFVSSKPFGKRISGYSLGNSLNDTRIYRWQFPFPSDSSTAKDQDQELGRSIDRHVSTNILKSVILFGSRNIYRTNHSFTGISPLNLFRRTAGKRPVVLVLSCGFVFIVAYMVLYERVVRQRTIELGQPLPFHPKFRLVILLCLRQTQSSPQRTTYRHFRTLFSILKRIRSN